MATEFPGARAWTTDDPESVPDIDADDLDGERFAVAESSDGRVRSVWDVRRASPTDARVSLWRCEDGHCERTRDATWWAIGPRESLAEFTERFTDGPHSMKVKQARVYHDRGRVDEVTDEHTSIVLRILSRVGIRN